MSEAVSNSPCLSVELELGVRRLRGTMAKVIVVALIGMTVAAAGPACAQGRGVELTPYVGIYVPLANVIDERTTQEMDGVIVGTETQAGHKTGLALGGRLTVWLSERIGAQGSFNYAFSDLGASGAHVYTFRK